jgi:hypothetical protein
LSGLVGPIDPLYRGRKLIGGDKGDIQGVPAPQDVGIKEPLDPVGTELGNIDSGFRGRRELVEDDIWNMDKFVGKETERGIIRGQIQVEIQGIAF